MKLIHLGLLAIITGLLIYFSLTKEAPVVSKNTITSKVSPKYEQYIPPKLTLESIFSKNNDRKEQIPQTGVTVLMATGDIIPARTVNYNAASFNNFLWPYEKISGTINKADITLVNLEAPLVKDCPVTDSGMVFCGDPKHIDGLVKSGVDIVNFANNHMGNYGIEGINNTKKILDERGILSTGIAGYTVKTVNGKRFSFLGYNEIGRPEEMISWAEDENIKSEIRKAKKDSDIVVVSFHWGVEYVSQPTERQVSLGHLAIDSGADLVIGNHPHWIQPVEIYRDKVITYAHGNFVFDQMWSEETREGVIGRYTFYGNKIIDVQFTPILIENYGQPNFPDEKRANLIYEKMKEESFKLTKNIE